MKPWYCMILPVAVFIIVLLCSLVTFTQGDEEAKEIFGPDPLDDGRL